MPRISSLGRLIFVVLLALVLAPLMYSQNSAQDDSLDQLLSSKESGLLTDWRVVGPFGKLNSLARVWAPEQDQLRKHRYGSHKSLMLQFPSGRFELPTPLKSTGVFYASSEVWISNGGEWRIYTETAGAMLVYVDGKQLIQRKPNSSLETTSEVLHMERGTHRIMVKFLAATAPFQVAVMPQTGGLRKRNNKPYFHDKPESEYTVASLFPISAQN